MGTPGKSSTRERKLQSDLGGGLAFQRAGAYILVRRRTEIMGSRRRSKSSPGKKANCTTKQKGEPMWGKSQPLSNYMYACFFLVAKSYPTLCDPMDCSPPGSSVHGILQARILEWVAISFSRGSSRPRDRTHIS